MPNEYINKIVINGETRLDLTGDTVDADTLVVGAVAHDRTGAAINGANPYAKAATDSEVAVQAGLIEDIRAVLEERGGVPEEDTVVRQIIERSVTDMVFPADLTSVGAYAFYNCTGLKAKNALPETVTEIGSYAFYGCGQLELSYLPAGITEIGGYAFHSCSKITVSELPQALTMINPYAFMNCENITVSEIPSGVTNIGACAFYGCTGITVSELPPNLTTLAQSAFKGCSNITVREIPEGVTILQNYSFQDCTGLTEMTIPSGVTRIGTGTFQGCSGIREFHVKPTTPPTITSSTFTGIASDCVIYVPSSRVSTYKAATYWKNYASKIQAEPEVEE